MGEPLATPREKGYVDHFAPPQLVLGKPIKAAEAAAKLRSWRRFILQALVIRSEQLLGVSNREGGHHKSEMNDCLPHHRRVIHAGRIDKGFQQVD